MHTTNPKEATVTILILKILRYKIERGGDEEANFIIIKCQLNREE